MGPPMVFFGHSYIRYLENCLEAVNRSISGG